jgi:hypothetical protein
MKISNLNKLKRFGISAAFALSTKLDRMTTCTKAVLLSRENVFGKIVKLTQSLTPWS